MSKKIIVIGSGFAGLSAACNLAAEGFDVTMLEKNGIPGGRARKYEAEGFVFDMGPSWYWMPDVFEQLEKNRDYMQRRAPRKVEFDFPKPGEYPPLQVGINAPLFDWVLENLLRNAIDSMEGGVGKISAKVYEEGRFVCLDISDTGKGIPAGKFKTVFKPGYSTKTRGWGLGLSLSKRIIEQYHRGKIFVKASEIGKGTTFTVKMPKAK